MPEEAQYAYMATRQALEMAKMDQEFIDSHEVGIIYGNDSVAEATMEALDKFREFKDTEMCGSGAIFQSMNSTISMNLACLFHLKRHQPHGVVGLLIVEPGYRSGRTAHPQRSAGLCCLWRCRGEQYVRHSKLRRHPGFLHP